MDLDAIEQRFVGAFPDTPEEEAILQLVAEIRRLRELCGEASEECRFGKDYDMGGASEEMIDRLRAASKGEL